MNLPADMVDELNGARGMITMTDWLRIGKGLKVDEADGTWKVVMDDDWLRRVAAR